MNMKDKEKRDNNIYEDLLRDSPDYEYYTENIVREKSCGGCCSSKNKKSGGCCATRSGMKKDCSTCGGCGKR